MPAGAVLPRLRLPMNDVMTRQLFNSFLRSQSALPYGRLNHTNSDPRAFALAVSFLRDCIDQYVMTLSARGLCA